MTDIFAASVINAIHVSPLWWIGTFLFFTILLIGDLYLNRKLRGRFSLKKSIIRSVAWISVGLILGLVIWAAFGGEASSRYYAGFLIEKALSVDNIFVWAVILSYFRIPKKYHYKVLFWGIFGAILFRVIFVFAGIAVIEAFKPILLLLGLGLMVLAYRLYRSDDKQVFDPQSSKIVKALRSLLRISPKSHEGKFIIKEHGKLYATPLLFTVLVIEFTDILFAIDSVPAVIAVARDPYIIIASNIAAILGLRSLYFVFEWLQDRFYLLNKGLSIILFTVGISLLLEPKEIFGISWTGITIPPLVSVAFIVVVLTSTIILSSIRPKLPHPAKNLH